jgi:hypothetical protein
MDNFRSPRRPRLTDAMLSPTDTSIRGFVPPKCGRPTIFESKIIGPGQRAELYFKDFA